MRVVLWLIGLFALAVGLSLFAQVSNGYAILIVPPYRAELSLNLMAVLLVAAIALTYLVIRAVAIAVSLPDKVQTFQRHKKLKAARHALREASLAWFEGRYQKAEREALKSLDDVETDENRALALLIAARAAHAMKDGGKRDAYLSRLEDMGPRAQLARHMVSAELLFEQKQLDAALREVEAARAESPNLTAALTLELKIRQRQQAPDAVLGLTEKLLKADAISAEQARRYRLAAWLQQLGAHIDPAELKRWWSKIPVQEKSNDDLVLAVARQAGALGDPALAVSLLADRLDAEWSDVLAGAIGQYVEGLSDEQRLALVKRADRWLAGNSRDAKLLLTLGRLARAQQLWGKAQGYLEASASLEPSLAAHAELARMFEQLDRPDDAARHYEASVALALAQA